MANYDIPETVQNGDPGHAEHHRKMANAINDLDSRVTGGAASGQTPEIRVLNGVLQTKLPSELSWRDLYTLPAADGGGGGFTGPLDGGAP